MEKMIVDCECYEGPCCVPKELCSIDRLGGIDDVSSCEEYCEMVERDCTKCAIQKCFDRLAEYEKIGLTPEQIHEVDKLYAEKCKEVAALNKELEELRIRKHKKKSMLKRWCKRRR